jgi:imidazoleglycerol-phosphate dehydratase
VLSTAAFDFAGRYGFRFDADFKREKVGDLSTELVRHFWDAFAQNAKANLFIRSEYGSNDHHRAEGMFKAVARSVRMACEPDPRQAVGAGPPSTKGSL